MKKLNSNLVLVLLTLVGISLSQTATGAGVVNPGVIDLKGTVAGKSYAEWGDASVQRVSSIPAAVNPLLDTTGENASQGQSGPVWFLAGNLGGVDDRSVTVPAGKALLVHILAYIVINLPELGDDAWSKDQESSARDLSAAAVDGVTDLACEIDGVAIKSLASYRFKTAKGRAFMVNLPADDLFEFTNAGVIPGSHGPCVTDGLYLILAPLSPGQHTIHFTAAVPVFFEEVTYHITVQ